MVSLGFLMPAAHADTVDDALRCLEERAAAESARDRLLAAADSIGREVDAIRKEGRSPQGSLLRQAERIQRDGMDRELELLTLRERCRALARGAIGQLNREIAPLRDALAAGDGTAEQTARLLRLTETRSLLEGGLAEPVLLGYPVLRADSTDTQETLRAKLLYYQDVQGYLEGLGGRVADRRAQVERERRSLVEAERFLGDLDLIDEGGRVSSGGMVRIRGAGGGEVPPPGGSARSVGQAVVGGRAGDLEFVLGASPRTPEESDRLMLLLDDFRTQIERELEAIAKERAQIEARILPEASAPR